MQKEMSSLQNVETDFRLALQKEFVERCRKNPRYSLRAFARSLDIGASPLSALLRGKRPLTKKMKTRLGLALGLSLTKIDEFKDGHGSTEFQQITIDNYAIISDWYHFAILELIKTSSFKPNAVYVAKTLGISQTEANIAIERLQRVGLLEIRKNQWVDTSKNGFVTNINDDLTSAAAMKLQRQILQMSIKALEEVPIARRNHTSMTMAIHPDDLPEAKKRIKKFRRELCKFFEKNKVSTEIYHLGFSLYPVTNKEN